MLPTEVVGPATTAGGNTSDVTTISGSITISGNVNIVNFTINDIGINTIGVNIVINNVNIIVIINNIDIIINNMVVVKNNDNNIVVKNNKPITPCTRCSYAAPTAATQLLVLRTRCRLRSNRSLLIILGRLIKQTFRLFD